MQARNNEGRVLVFANTHLHQTKHTFIKLKFTQKKSIFKQTVSSFFLLFHGILKGMQISKVEKVVYLKHSLDGF